MQATPSKKRARFAVVGIIAAVIIIALFLIRFFPPPRGPLKQNEYKRTFDDLQGLLSLDAIIHYETEEDGTWRRSDVAKYNVTVFVKPTYVKESVISKVNVIRWYIIGLENVSGGWLGPADEPPPIDYGIELMGFWMNQSAWHVASQVCQFEWPYYAPREAGATWTISFWFVIREILANGTSRSFNWADSLFIYWSG